MFPKSNEIYEPNLTRFVSMIEFDYSGQPNIW